MTANSTSPEYLQRAGDYRIGTALVVGASGMQVNIKHLIAEVNIYQDINTPFISGNMVIQDARGIYELLPFLGQERLLFELSTPSSSGMIDMTEYSAWIYNIQDRFPTTDRSQTYVIQFTTNEAYKNLRTKVSQSFSGTIGNMVADILKNDTYLGTKKNVTVDPTMHSRKFIAPNLRPFRVINQLKEHAISQKGEPYFVFYEDPYGFQFRSLDSLLGVAGESAVVHKRTFKSQVPDDPNDIDDQMSLLLSFHIDDSNNTLTNTGAGMFNSTLTVHDVFNKQVNRYIFNYMEDSYNIRNNTNQDSGSSGPMVAMTPVDRDGNSIVAFPDAKHYLHPSSSGYLHMEGSSSSPEYNYVDNMAAAWMMENRSRELELDYFTLDVAMYGDTGLSVGNLINLVIPSNKPQNTTGGPESRDSILSGRYLITSLRHKVNTGEGIHTMHCKIMKDSVIEAFIEQATPWDEEPTGDLLSAFGTGLSLSSLAAGKIPNFDLSFPRPSLPEFKIPGSFKMPSLPW